MVVASKTQLGNLSIYFTYRGTNVIQNATLPN